MHSFNKTIFRLILFLYISGERGGQLPKKEIVQGKLVIKKIMQKRDH